jgi:CRISPR system Cascade subunit CasE
METNQTQPGFYMINMWLDAKQFMQLGRMLRFPLRKTSNNYLIHCSLSELFQEQAPIPYCVEDQHRQITDYQKNNGRYIRILCYSELDKTALQNLARGFASPTVYEIVDWNRMDSKKMPDEYPAGMRLGFELRSCPVVRKASDGKKWKAGQEVDAYLSRVWEVDDPEVNVDREETYINWLNHQLETRDGAILLSADLKRFSIERMSRRNHKPNRTVTTIKRPDIILSGKMEVTDSDSFKELLRTGISRHKSFGYGMLKIRRA